MTATNTTVSAKDGNTTSFTMAFATESVSGAKAAVNYLKSPSTENPVEPAQDGVDATGITAPTGGSGIRGWLSGIYSLLSNVLGVKEVGSSNWATTQVSVTNAATQLVAARAGRQGVVVTNLGTTPVYLGGSGVTTATGAFLPGVAGASKTIPAATAVYGIVGTGTQNVSVEELY